MEEPYKDCLGRTIKIGDSVVFPMPGSDFMLLGTGVVKGWDSPRANKKRIKVEVQKKTVFIKELRAKQLCIYKRAE